MGVVNVDQKRDAAALSSNIRTQSLCVKEKQCLIASHR